MLDCISLNVNNCLVVVNVQKETVSGTFAVAEAPTVLSRIVNKMEVFCGTIVLTQVTQNDSGWELHPKIVQIQKEKCLPVYSSHGEAVSNKLIKDLKAAHANLPFQKIEIVGFHTESAVSRYALALKTVMPEMQIWIDAKCCTGNTPSLHANALMSLREQQILIS